jgi:PD-(D/E)XK nuclease superfamily
VELTDPQRRTLDRLIGTHPRPTFPADLAQRLRDRIEEAVRELELREPLWLGKEKVTDHGRCEGKFASAISGESPPFEHSPKSAAGVLLHRAVEVEVGARDGLGPHEIAEIAADRLVEREERFAEYWNGFQGSFPPLKALRRELTPISEMPVKAELLGGALILSGRIDLVLGAPDKLEPTRATRLAIDLKTGNAYPEYPEDLRYYALLLTLRFGVPPYRVASLFLESGEWQAEDVGEHALQHAADRVIAAARGAAALWNGRQPALTPGVYCGWCPRAETCPAAQIAPG